MFLNKSQAIISLLILSNLFILNNSDAMETKMQLIKNGQFEKWRNGIPEHWEGNGISIDKERSDDGLCVKFGPAPEKGQPKNFISRKLPDLKPKTVYRVDFFVQRDKARKGSVTFTVSGCDGKNLRFSGNGGYFSHLAGYRYTRYFTVGKKVDSEKAKITFSGSDATLDAVSVTPLDGGFNGIEFTPPGNDGILKFRCGIFNQTSLRHNYKIDYDAVDFYGRPLAQKELEIGRASCRERV